MFGKRREGKYKIFYIFSSYGRRIVAFYEKIYPIYDKIRNHDIEQIFIICPTRRAAHIKSCRCYTVTMCFCHQRYISEVTDQLVLTVGYDTSNLTDPERRMRYNGPVRTDHYGRQVPKEAHGSINLDRHTSSGRIITEAMMKLFDRCVDPNLLVRRITVVAAHVLNETDVPAAPEEQPDLFTDYEALEEQKAEEQAELDKEKRLQQAVLNIKKRMGANAILKGMNLEEGATGKARNEQIGGHRK